MATRTIPGQKYSEGQAASELITDYAPLIKGKTILCVGVTPGSIGAAYAESVAAASPGLLILAGRNATKLDDEATQIKAKNPRVPLRNLMIDLASLESVRKAAAEINSWDDVKEIHVVHFGAGIMAHPYSLSPEGHEYQFAANYLGNFLLANLIMDKLLASGKPRVVNVSSNGHRLSHMRWDDINFDDGKVYNPWTAYGQSKTANMLHSISLAEKLGTRGLQSYSLHPGLVLVSNLSKHLDLSDMHAGDFDALLKTDRELGNREGKPENFAEIMPLNAEQGAATSVYASFDPDLGAEDNGKYLEQCRVADPMLDTVKPWATSSVEAEKLWQLSEKMVGQKFSY